MAAIVDGKIHAYRVTYHQLFIARRCGGDFGAHGLGELQGDDGHPTCSRSQNEIAGCQSAKGNHAMPSCYGRSGKQTREYIARIMRGVPQDTEALDEFGGAKRGGVEQNDQGNGIAAKA